MTHPAGQRPPAPVWRRVPGQATAVAVLASAVPAPVHAYLLLGPTGSGKRDAALSFAAALLCPDGGCGACRHCTRALAAVHPDLSVIDRAGAAIGVDVARDVAQLAVRSPVEAARLVIVMTELQLVDRAAPALLKTVEEPPAGVVFVLLADSLPPALVTLASRCVIVPFRPLGTGEIVEALVASGADRERAEAAAAAAGGRLDRARLLVGDDGLADRRSTWAGVGHRLDGTGATVARLVDELLALTDRAVEPIRAAQGAEAAALAGELRSAQARRELDERHRRELRRARIDELRSGLAALAAGYGGRLGRFHGSETEPEAAAGAGPGPDDRGAPGGRNDGAMAVRAIRLVQDASDAFTRNAGEVLVLQSLLVQLSALAESLEQIGRPRALR